MGECCCAGGGWKWRVVGDRLQDQPAPLPGPCRPTGADGGRARRAAGGTPHPPIHSSLGGVHPLGCDGQAGLAGHLATGGGRLPESLAAAGGGASTDDRWVWPRRRQRRQRQRHLRGQQDAGGPPGDGSRRRPHCMAGSGWGGLRPARRGQGGCHRAPASGTDRVTGASTSRIGRGLLHNRGVAPSPVGECTTPRLHPAGDCRGGRTRRPSPSHDIVRSSLAVTPPPLNSLSRESSSQCSRAWS